ncbi:MAG: hypothetical protein JXR31_09420 [Prolixibacteraceae bacterium]|nr:hypothetical protein [Prolixibacteraceae bacterium]MBN2774453.1 hypothetical protein [Prolixibacteraceae bacterium]
MQEKRRLAAIMFTDMVGYSALTQEDEAFALDLLEEHRQILRFFFQQHDGREVETVGDAFLVEFASVLDAVNCAIEIQKGLWKRNLKVPEKNQIKIRIGIHLSDVVPKGKNVLGDGVNIASRIEAYAPIGGICVSEDVARQVQNKIDFSLAKIEKKKLKNIKKRVTIYIVEFEWLEVSPLKKSFKVFKNYILFIVLILFVITSVFLGIKFSDRFFSENKIQVENQEWANSVAVLPFVDLSSEGDQEYFCDGTTEQIITNLARLGTLKVIARTSTMKFKGSDKTIPEIGKELNVNNILEGSIRKYGNRIRITAQLVKTLDGSHIWAEEYDREDKELFIIQDDIAKSIADTLYKKLSLDEENLIKSKSTPDIKAYEYFLKAQFIHRNKFWSSANIMDFKESESMFLKAIELDSTYAPAYAGLADLYNTYWNTQVLSDVERMRCLNLQEKYINIAYDLDKNSADVNRVLGWIYGARNQIDKKFEYIKKAVELDNNDPENISAMGICFDNIGLKEIALGYYDRCIKLDPYDAKNYYYVANIYNHLGQMEKSKTYYREALNLEPNDPKYLLNYILLLLQMKENKEALKWGALYNQYFPATQDNQFLKAVFLAYGNEKEKALAVNLHSENRMRICLILQMNNMAVNLMENYFERVKDSERSNYIEMMYNPIYNFLRSDTRFRELLAQQKEIYQRNLKKYGGISNQID